jgi:Flp pilus assembly protein TadB
MTRLPEGRREVYPSRTSRPKRRAPDFGPGLNVSVPISFGLPLVVVGIALIAAAVASGGVVLWVAGGVATAGGVLLFASGKRL